MTPVPVRRAVLVACVAQKKNQPAPAADLYMSDWFQKAKAYVCASQDQWFILSAEHGLVLPSAIIHPYDRTLSKMTASERWVWARRAADQITSTLPEVLELEVLAGRFYRDGLIPLLQDHCPTIRVPMEGMGIGQQKRWLKRAAAGLDGHLTNALSGQAANKMVLGQYQHRQDGNP